MKRIVQIAPFVISLALFILPFFWLHSGQVDLGGDSSRLYFYDPVSYLRSNTLYGVAASGFGSENINYFALPHIAFLALLRQILSPMLLSAAMHGTALSFAFLFTYASLCELFRTEWKKRTTALSCAAILAGLLYALSPALIDGWQYVLITRNQIFLNPLMFYLLLRYFKTASFRYLSVALILSFIFSPNFSVVAAPAILAFYPLTIVFFLAYSVFVLGRPIVWKHLFAAILLLVLLQLFHVLPQVISIFSSDTGIHATIFSEAGKFDRGLQYFTAIAPNIKVSINLLGLPQMTDVGKYSWIFFGFPLIIVSAFYFNKKKTLPLVSFFFLIILFFATANITNTGFQFYRSLFSIPGFSMFRNFYGQWQFAYIFYYCVVFGVALATMLQVFRTWQKIIILTLLGVLIIGNAFPFLKGEILARPLWQSDSVAPIIRMDPKYEELLGFIRTLPADGKVLTLPLTDPAYQLIAGADGGAYVGPSTISYLGGKKDFSGYEEFLEYKNLIVDLFKRKEYETLKKIFGVFNIRYVFYNADPGVYDSFPAFPYIHVRKYLPQTQESYKQMISDLQLKEIKNIDNKFFVYELPEPYYVPEIYIPDKSIELIQHAFDLRIPISWKEVFRNIALFVQTEKTVAPNIPYAEAYVELVGENPVFDFLKNTEDTRLPWAFVAQKVDTFLYPLIIWREQQGLSKMGGVHDGYMERSLFLAEKRVNELLKFGKEMPVVGNVSDIEVYRAAWIEPRVIDALLYQKYNSWEVSFVRYLNAMDKLIDEINAPNSSSHSIVTNKALISRQLILHKTRVFDGINESKRFSDGRKLYLTKLAVQVFDHLEKKLALTIPPLSHISYAFTGPAGAYDIMIGTAELEASQVKSWQVRLGDTVIPQEQFARVDQWFVYHGAQMPTGLDHVELEVLAPHDVMDGNEWKFIQQSGLGTPIGSVSTDSVKLTVSNGLVWSITDMDPRGYYILSFDYNTNSKDFRLNWKEGEKEKEGQWEQTVAAELQSSDWKTFQTVIRTRDYTGAGYLQITKENSNTLIDGLTPDVPYDEIEIRNMSFVRVPNPSFLLHRVVNQVDEHKSPTISFSQVNPTKYNVHIQGVTEPFVLVFGQMFSPKWQLVDAGGRDSSRSGTLMIDNQMFETVGKRRVAEDKHFLVNGYANGWYIEPSDLGGKHDIILVLEMSTQSVFYMSLVVSIATFGLCIWIFLRSLFS